MHSTHEVNTLTYQRIPVNTGACIRHMHSTEHSRKHRSKCHTPIKKSIVSFPQVNFASKSFPTVPYTHPDSAPLRVLAKLLSSKYCHREIREKGGAYGGGATGSTEGHFAFYSYRDPRSLETLEVYDKAVRWAADGQFTDTDVDEAKMGLFQQVEIILRRLLIDWLIFEHQALLAWMPRPVRGLYLVYFDTRVKVVSRQTRQLI